jgi:hypothetical protein
MSRLLLIVGLVLLALFATTGSADDRSRAIETKRVALEDELRVLLQDHGPTHLAVIALKERIALLTADAAQGKEINPKGLLVVFSKEKSATLKDARIRSLGGRSFVVGRAVEGPKITKPDFVGWMVWIPVDDVIQMVEVEDPQGK